MCGCRCDPGDQRHIVRMLDSFLFHKHLCIVFEKLDVNLFELLKRNSFRGLSLSLVQVGRRGQGCMTATGGEAGSARSKHSAMHG